jgi:iron(III) transport system ATP-binding protein
MSRTHGAGQAGTTSRRKVVRPMSDLQVSQLRRAFGKTGDIVAVNDVSFSVAPGEMLVLVGASGCGKTTTLRCIAGLEKPDAGTINFGDRTIFDANRKVIVPIHRRDIGLVFQNYALWPHLSGWENIAFPLRARNVSSQEREKKVRAIAEVVELDPRLLDKRPAQLSGGQQQRIALARALVAEPAVVLFDEPLSNLDAALREQLRSELRRLHEQIGFTGVYVTHDLSEAMLLGDRVAAMADGSIEQIGRPRDLFENPQTRRIARMMGYRRLCTATARHGRWDSPDCTVSGSHPSQAQAGASFEIMARADSITPRLQGSIGVDNETLIGGGTVVGVGYLGAEQELVIDFRGRRLRLATPQGQIFSPGEPVELAVRPGLVRTYEITPDSTSSGASALTTAVSTHA